MSADAFTRQIEAAHQRLLDLEQRASGSTDQPSVTIEALEELSTAMEELHVAAEELRQQNEELAAARYIAEAERQRYQELFEFAPDGYLVTDPEGIIREANRAASALLGVRQDFLIGKPLLVFVAEQDQQAFHTRLTQLHTTDVISRDLPRLEIMLQPRDGEPFPVSLTVGLVHDAESQLAGLRWLLRDITERVRAGKELGWLASFPKLNPNPVIEVDLSGHVGYLNPAAKRLFPDLLTEPQHPWLEGLAELADKFRTETPGSTLREITLGEACYQQSLHYVAEQQRVRIYGFDITERKRAEEKLAYQAHLLANVNDAIVASDDQYRLTAWNAAAESLYGWKADEVLGRVGLEILQTEYPGVAKSEMLRRIAESGRWRGEATQARKDGTRIHVEVASLTLRDETGRITGYVSVNRDITDRKRTEEALRKAHDELEVRVKERTLDLVKANEELQTEIASRERAQAARRETEAMFRTLAETTSAAIFITHGFHILYANPAATTITGYTSDELMDMPIWAIAHPTYQGLLQQRGVANQWLDNVPSRYELKIVTKDSEERWLDITAGSIQFEGQPASVMTAFDITERDRVEKALQQAKQDLEVRVAERTAELQQANVELQARNEALDAFAQTVAHDLKNLLNIILGYAEELAARDASLRADERLAYLQNIASGARKLNIITDELMLVAEVHHLEAVAEPLHMATIVDEAQQRLTKLIETYQAEINLYEPSAWPIVMGYDSWIEEVWVNYLSNALKYGGRPPRIELGAQPQPDGMVRFWIHDNGSGLTPADQARLFAPFTRLNRARGIGHGLGLSIVRRIVEKLGGQAGVESQPGQGSTFFFTLPAAGYQHQA
jgi:PAS domain S-box-containing protein